MFERFTDRARKVMALANQEAQRLNHEYIGTEHVLLGLVKEGSGVGATVLKNLDVDIKRLRQEVEKLVKSGPGMVIMGKLPQTPHAKRVIEYAIEEARALDHNYVGTEHLLLGLLRQEEGIAAQVLANLGLKVEDVRHEVLVILGCDQQSDADHVHIAIGKAARPDADHQDTLAWAKANDLAHTVYKVTEEFPKEKIAGVGSQLRRTALLLPPNIAEAYERKNKGEARWHANIALGLLRELRYGWDFAVKLEYLKPGQRQPLAELADEIETELRGFHDSLGRP
jgi:four helix bundle protein